MILCELEKQNLNINLSSAFCKYIVRCSASNKFKYMKIAVTVTVCHQIGIETWQDFHTTKVFEENSTIKEIDDWIKSIDKNSSFSNVKISLCVE